MARQQHESIINANDNLAYTA